MKKLVLVFCFIVLASPKTYSLLWFDNFEYPVGDTLAHHWGSLSPLGVNYIRISSPGLTFPSYAGSGIGNAAKLDTTTPDGVGKIFSIPGISTGSVYGSFMIRVFSAGAAGNYFTAISSLSGLGDNYCRVFIRDSSGSVAFGISKNIESPIYTAARYLRNITYLLVLKYTFNPGISNDSVSLFVFSSPPPFTEPVPTLGPKGSSAPDLSNAEVFKLYQGFGGPSLGAIFDGIYVDLSWNNLVLPIELSSFNATVNKQDVILNWSTASEVNNSRFDVERQAANGNPHWAEDVWNKIGFVNGNGTTTSPIDYSFTDKGLSSGKYNYRLKQIDINGNFKYFSLSNEVVIGIPTRYDLTQNYPNPFNPTTKIDYDLPSDGIVTIKIFDNNGREIKTIVNEFKQAGYWTIEFDGSNLSSGIYFYKLESNNFVATMKMVLLK